MWNWTDKQWANLVATGAGNGARLCVMLRRPTVPNASTQFLWAVCPWASQGRLIEQIRFDRSQKNQTWWWFQMFGYFHPDPWGFMIQFDYINFSNGSKPPTSKAQVRYLGGLGTEEKVARIRIPRFPWNAALWVSCQQFFLKKHLFMQWVQRREKIDGKLYGFFSCHSPTLCTWQKSLLFMGSSLAPPKAKHNWVVVSNVFYVHPYLAKISNLTNIFQMGWNHQLDKQGPFFLA